MNRKLIRPIYETEIKEAVFSMHPNKAPGPDGMSPFFFQRFWNIIKNDVIRAVLSFFRPGKILKAFNETLISLIPKVEHPIFVSQLRPISLCNVFYKIISKILVNRLKPILGQCISQNQSAFVPGRQIIDNVLMAHEYIHWLNRKRNGKESYMAIKLDMLKAYDRVEWGFLAKKKWVFVCSGSNGLWNA